MHLEQADGQGHRRLPQKSARHLVAQPEGSHGQRRLRGDVQSQSTASLVLIAVRFGLHAGLPVPRLDQGYAHQSDRHRALQVRGVQARRIGDVRPQPGLLEEGAALSRRYRVEGDRKSLHPHPCVCGRRVRYDVQRRRHGAAPEGCNVASSQGDLRAGADLCVDQPDYQSEGGALQRPQDFARRWRSASIARPMSIS